MSQTLVAYFSASGVTEGVAKTLAEAIGADLHEIKPETPYSNADLNWNDPTSRPGIANQVEDMEAYDKIFVGFPIWWYVAPTIINTFLEQYDLSGKKVIPFATSGSSGMGNTNRELEDSCKGADLCEGKRFASNASAAELKKWADKF